ncbi:mechanosensitive ion channel family protein [Agarivorans albus]
MTRLALFWLFLLSAAHVSSTEMSDLSTELDNLLKKAIQLSEVTPHEEEFYESIIRRENDLWQESFKATLLDHPDQNDVTDSLITRQIKLLQTLLTFSYAKLEEDLTELRNDIVDDRLGLELEAQRRISTMDHYYQQLLAFILLAEQRLVSLGGVKQEFSQTLKRKAEFLSNAILFLNIKKKEAEGRLPYVIEQEEQLLQRQVIHYNERISAMVNSLDSSVDMLEVIGEDVARYKQLQVTTTGEISVDLFDPEVALGLIHSWVKQLTAWVSRNASSVFVKLLVFIGVLYLSKVVASMVKRLVKASLNRASIDISLLTQDFFTSIASKLVLLIGFFFALAQIGINLAPLLAGFGVAGIIVGFALQETLSNFASGLMILIYRPYDVGDMVNITGIQGTVKKMTLVSTTLQTVDNQRLVIPNNKIWGDVINNITAERVRRVDMTFSVDYAEDVNSIKALLGDLLAEDSRVLKSPAPMIRLHLLGESSMDFVVRPWVRTEDYWDVYWDITERVKQRFDEENITIPFPQRSIHISQE